jgi:hypothetical protein
VVELSAERKAAQEAQREREEGLAHASQARLACLQAIAAGRVSKAELLDQLAWALIENTEWSVAEHVACRILGIDPAGRPATVRKRSRRSWQPRRQDPTRRVAWPWH